MQDVTRVALVTARAARARDADLPLIVTALQERELATDVVDWDDPSVSWSSYALVVVRSPWDYALRRDEFLEWADAVAAVAPLLNPPDVLRWNTDKRYLLDLQAAEIPVVPTIWVDPEDGAGEGAASLRPDLEQLLAAGPSVVKPAVSAGAKDTERYGVDAKEAARGHVSALTAAGRTAMLQPYVAAIDERGETAVVFIGGTYSHAIRKAAILRPALAFVDGLYAEERISPREPSRAELAAAQRVLDAVPGGPDRLLYARVDLVPGPAGDPLLLELEVTEPSLFLEHAPGSAERFASAVCAVLD